MTIKTQISQNELAKLEQLFTLVNRAEIIAFLEQNPYLISGAIEAVNKIWEVYPNSPLRLELQKDLEIPTWETLTIVIEKWDENNPELTVGKLRNIWFSLADIPNIEELMITV